MVYTLQCAVYCQIFICHIGEYMSDMSVIDVDYQDVNEALCETKELNPGFDIFERDYFLIAKGNYKAYAVLYDFYDEDDDLPELARFFVPKEFRKNGFGKLAAKALIDHILKSKCKFVIEPVNDSVNFWEKVFLQFDGGLNFQNIGGTKNIVSKINS